MIAKGTSRLKSLDARIRECRGHYDRQTIWRCVVELQEICETYLRQQDKAAGQFGNCFGESHEMAAAGEQLEAAILEQSAQLEATISNLRHMDFESDLPATSRRLLTEIERMLTAGSKLLDGMEAVFPTIPRHDAD